MCQRRKNSLQYYVRMIKFYIELLYDSGSQVQSPHTGGKGLCMNQNGFVPRNNMPGYSYGQPNTSPQNGYPGPGAPVQGGIQNSGAFSAQNNPAPAFGFSAPQARKRFRQHSARNTYDGRIRSGFSDAGDGRIQSGSADADDRRIQSGSADVCERRIQSRSACCRK